MIFRPARIPSEDRPPLEVAGMTVAYRHRPVLWEVDFAARAGRLTAIVGPNGAGKSTFIKACMGLVPRASGAVRYWGLAWREARSKVGYVPQRESVDWDFPVSALDVVAMGRYRRIGFGRPVRGRDRRAAHEHLERVGLADLADRQIRQLSGGQQQRVFLARALAQEAELLFMDEPFAGIDAATEESILAVLQELKHEGKTVLVVHHDLPTVARTFDDVLMLNMRVVAQGEVRRVFDAEHLRQTYGERSHLVREVVDAVARHRDGA